LPARAHRWELGNELNSCLDGVAGARAQADDFKALRALVAELYAKASATTPLLIGPDTHSNAEFRSATTACRLAPEKGVPTYRCVTAFRGGRARHVGAVRACGRGRPEGLEWFAAFADEAGAAVDVLTFHMCARPCAARLKIARAGCQPRHACMAYAHTLRGACRMARALHTCPRRMQRIGGRYSMGSGPALQPSALNASFLNAAALDQSGAGAARRARAHRCVRAPHAPVCGCRRDGAGEEARVSTRPLGRRAWRHRRRQSLL
jgi:hypothetical protein